MTLVDHRLRANIRALRRSGPLALLFAVFLGSCDNPLSPDQGGVGRVDVQPQALVLAAGTTANLTARVYDDRNKEIVGHPFWATQNPLVATVSQTGVVTAVAPGATQIAASVGGRTGFSAVTVGQRPAALVRLTPGATNLLVGATLQLGLEVLDAGGGQIVGRTATWSSSDVAIATVTTGGVVTGVAAGTATIHAVVDGIDGSAVITVLPVPVAAVTIAPPNATIQVGETAPLTATAVDATGNALTGRTIVWASSNNTVAAVSQTGVVTGIGAGTATVTATSPGGGAGGSSPIGSAVVTVALVPAARVDVTPASASIRVGDVTNFAVNLFDAANSPLSTTGRQISWSSSNASVASINATTGSATGVATGSVTITANVATPGQIGNAIGTATLLVSNVPVASVVVTPNPATVHIGSLYARRFSAKTLDPQGDTLNGRAVVWTSSNQAVASVDAGTGIVTGISQGTAQIRAVSEGVQGAATVTIDVVPIVQVLVAPAVVTLIPPATQTLTATPVDSAGNPVTGSALGGQSTVWTSSNAAVASVSAGGVVTAVALGSASVRAAIGSTSGTATVTVLATAGSVSFAMVADTIIGTGTLTGSITVTDANNTPLANRAVSLSSSNSTVATVSPASATTNGAGSVSISITCVSAGSATITATSGPVTGTFVVRVLNRVNTVALASPGDSVIAGRTLQATATLKDASNNVLTGRPITWSSGTPSVATVNTSGVITGVAAGNVVITATSEGKSGTLGVRVLAAVNSVTLTSPGDSIIGTSTLQATATLKDASNNVLTGRTIAWSSGNTAVATVNSATGLITGVAAGSVTITATCEGTSGTLLIRVLASQSSVKLTAPVDSLISPPGGTLSATASVLDASNNGLPGRTVALSSSTTSVATVSPTTGTTNASGQVAVTITRVGVGSATITATSSGLNAVLVVRMLAQVNSVTLTAPGDSIVGTATLQTTATLRDASNNILTGRPLAWASSNPAAATVNSSGLVTGVSSGTATITATSETKSGTLIVRVLPAVASVTLTAAGDSIIGSGGSLAATATVRDATNTPLVGRAVTLSSNNTSIATVSPLSATTAGGGNVPVSITSVSKGSATITASSAGVNGTLVVRVLAPVNTVTVTAPGDSIIGTSTLQATATLRDASNNILTGRPVAWSSNATGIATVSATGLITGVSAGTVTITATSETKTGSITVRVLASVNSVTVTTPTDSIIGTATLQATATLKDAANNTLTGRVISWSSSSPGVATVGATTGLITGVASGTTTITATSEGKSGTKIIRVVPAVGSISVTAPVDSLIGPGTLAATATVRDAANTPLSGRSVTVTSSAPGVATVTPGSAISNGSGQVALTITNVAPGSTTISATSAEKTGTLVVRMLASVNTVSLTAPGDSIIGTGTLAVTATLRDASNTVLSGRPISWSSSNSATATVNAAGVVTGVTPGPVVITATSEGKSGTISLRVLAAVSSVTVAPSSASIIRAVNPNAALTVTVTDAFGNRLAGRACVMTSSDPTVATVSPGSANTAASGQIALTVTGKKAGGPTAITATCEGKSGTSSITVS